MCWTKTIDEVPDPDGPAANRHCSSSDAPTRQTSTWPHCRTTGCDYAGRLTGVDGRTVHLGADLAATTARADAGRHRLLTQIDDYIDANGLTTEVLDREPVRPVRAGGEPGRLDLKSEGISTVVWATGFRRRYPWLQIPVLDEGGEFRHRRGVTPVPGLYVLGLRFQHRRNSSFIDGVRHDAEYIANHLAARDRVPLGITSAPREIP